MSFFRGDIVHLVFFRKDDSRCFPFVFKSSFYDILVKLCHVSSFGGIYLDTLGTSAEENNCSGSTEIEKMTFLSRRISCSKCGMARHQHIIKSLANICALTTQSSRVSWRPSVLDSLASFPLGYILSSLAKKGGS